MQVNASYAINEMISFSLGIRYIIAKNSYVGNMKNIMINPNKTAFGAGYDGVNMVSAPTFFTDAATALTTYAATATATATSLGAYPGATPFSALPAANQAGIMALLGAADNTTTPATVGDAITALNAAAPVISGKATGMTGYAAMTADKEVDADQSGSGMSPIIGVDLKLSDKLNIGIRYEHKAEIMVQNKTKTDNIGLYPDGAKVPFDMPSTFSIGVAYKPMEKLAVSGGIHYYFDKTANYGKKDLLGAYVENKDVIDKNFLEIAVGFEYSLNEKLLVSAGYLRTQSGVNELYQNDLSHSLTTNTFGAGLRYVLNDKFAIDFGGMYSMYQEGSRDYAAGAIPAIYPAYTETYNRNAIVAAIGVNIKL